MRRIPALIFLFILLIISARANGDKVDSLKSLLKNSSADTTALKILNELSSEYKKQNDYDNALSFAKQTVDLCDKFLSKFAPAQNDGLGSSNTVVLNIYKKQDAIAVHNIGAIQYNKGNYEAALQNFFDMLKLMDETGNRNGVAEASNNIGLVYQALADYSEALKYSTAALRINEELKNKIGV